MKFHVSAHGPLGLLIETARRLIANRVIEMSAALAFYSALSLAPLVVITMGVAGLVVDRSVLQTHVVLEADRLLGHGSGELLQKLAGAERESGAGTLATVVGIVALLLGSTAVFGQLQDGLDRIWEAKPRKRHGVLLYVRKRLASLAMVVSLGFLLLVSLLVSAGLSVLADRVSPGALVAGTVAHLAASLIVAGLLFTLVFRVLPDTHVGWAEAAGGGALTSVLFHVGQWAIGAYLGRTAVASPYGAAGTLVVLLIWVYYSSVIIFAGAEFTHVYAQSRRGVPIRQHDPAQIAKPVGGWVE